MDQTTIKDFSCSIDHRYTRFCSKPVNYRIFGKSHPHSASYHAVRSQKMFTLDEIKHLLAANNGEEEFHSEEMHDFASSKAKEIEKKISDLTEMKWLLERLVEKCPGSGVPKDQCPIMKKLSQGAN